VTHPELNATFQLDIIGVKKNPNGQLFTGLGVLTKGTVIEVNVSECVHCAALHAPATADTLAASARRLGLVTPAGKVVWGKYAQVTNNPENDGCVNACAPALACHLAPAPALTRARAPQCPAGLSDAAAHMRCKLHNHSKQR
jgi:hypothetical protein